MSMNLTLEGVNLWQTPTHITWMCLSNNPKTKRYDGGAEGVRRRYLIWLAGKLDGSWDSREAMEDMAAAIEEHRAEVLAVKRPKFGFL